MRNGLITLAFLGPRIGRGATSLVFLVFPSKGGESERTTSPLPSWGPMVGAIATQPAHSQGVPVKGDKIRGGYNIPPFSCSQNGRYCNVALVLLGFPNTGDEERSGYITLAFLGPNSGRNCHVTQAFSGGPRKKGPKWRWLHHPYLLVCPKVGGIAM